MYRATLLLSISLLAATAAGQEATRLDPDRMWQFWLKGQGQLYENFFQATAGAEEESVSALFAEAGASVGLSGPLRAYGSVSTLRYDDSELDSSHGVRLGLRRDGQPHSFDVHVEQQMNRPTFDVGDEFDRADVRSLGGEYFWRFTDDWQVSADGELQQQENDISENLDNEFRSVGAAVRWRGSRLFSPEIGVRVGERDVDDATQSYDQQETYLQIRSSVTPALYLSLRLRNRSRDYSTGLASSSNFGRGDDRRQIALGAEYSFTPHLALDFYGARESVDSNRAGRDFDTGLWALGVTWRF